MTPAIGQAPQITLGLTIRTAGRQPNQTLGINLKGKAGAHGGIFIGSIVPGSLADHNGKLRPNDRLLKINSQELTGLSNNQAVEVLRSALAQGDVYFSISRTTAPDLASPPATPGHATPASAGRSSLGGTARPASTSSVLSPVSPRAVGPQSFGRFDSTHSDATVTAGHSRPGSGQGSRPASILQTAERRRRSQASPEDGLSRTGDVREAEIAVNPHGLGVTVVGGRGSAQGDTVRVNAVNPHGEAAKAGIRPGDILVEINGASLLDVSQVQAIQLLNQAKGSPTRDDALVSIAHVEGAPLGISLTGGTPTDTGAVEPVRIKAVTAGSAAAQDARLRPGVVLLAVNGASLEGQHLPRAQQILRRSQFRREGPATILRIRSASVTLRYVAGAGAPPVTGARSADMFAPGAGASGGGHAYGNTSSQAPSSAASTPDMDAASRRSRRRSRRKHGHRRLKMDELLNALQVGGEPVPRVQKQRIRGMLDPDADGCVSYPSFAEAVKVVLEGGPGIADQSLSDASTVSGNEEPGSTVHAGGSSRDELARPIPINRSRLSDHVRAVEDSVESVKYEKELLQQELQQARQQLRDADTNVKLANAARANAGEVEKDYDEVVALLEAEIAHLRSQLLAGPDEKDQQLVRRRPRWEPSRSPPQAAASACPQPLAVPTFLAPCARGSSLWRPPNLLCAIVAGRSTCGGDASSLGCS